MPDMKNKKLIEVALPLQAINKESAREKSIRHGHPSTLHLWWARRPLAACRAVIFASLVDDPGNHLPPAAADKERQRLFGIIERLVDWDNVNNEHVLAEAKAEIAKSTGGDPPAIFDPFCGGGSIPLEAQRLGLKAYASDLNPVAVLITKALIEIPPRFADHPPVNPDARRQTARHGYKGATGLADDIRYYGQRMRDEAEKRIGHLYPKGPNGETVIAWLWARTITCPNPACGIAMPLVRSFVLSTRKGHEAWVEPVVDHGQKRVRFKVHEGHPTDAAKAAAGTKVGKRGAKFRCPACGTVADDKYLRSEAQAGRMHARLMAIVGEGTRSRSYLDPMDGHEEVARSAVPAWKPEERVPYPNHDVDRLPMYGMPTWGDAFTPRQLVALTTFSDLVGAVREQVLADAKAAGMVDDGVPLHQGGHGAAAYADAVATYLGLAVSRMSNSLCNLSVWSPTRDQTKNAFSRQALPMVWDFAEINPFANAAGDLTTIARSMARILDSTPTAVVGGATRCDARDSSAAFDAIVICTDPPYYDNVGYADLSDFFYVWLRRSLRPIWPDLFRTVLTPKAEELIVNPYRFEGHREEAETHFRDGMRTAFQVLQQRTRPDYPATVFYAFKQTDSEDADTAEGESGSERETVASRGWETMLTGLVDAGFQINGTWPMRTERAARTNQIGTNALASSIVLVCRPRSGDAPVASRQEFVNALHRELPDTLDQLTKGGIAAVDLQQAAIGPGMAVFSRYRAVLKTQSVEGQPSSVPMGVREALELINRELDAYLSREQGQLDNVSRFCLAWFESYGWEAGAYGDADVVLRARNTSEHVVQEAGVVSAKGGRVQLIPLHRPEEADQKAPANGTWPAPDGKGITVWGAALRMAGALAGDVGIEEAARIYAGATWAAEPARELAYRLFAICERKGLGEDAQRFNDLVAAWHLVRDKAANLGGPKARALF